MGVCLYSGCVSTVGVSVQGGCQYRGCLYRGMSVQWVCQYRGCVSTGGVFTGVCLYRGCVCIVGMHSCMCVCRGRSVCGCVWVWTHPYFIYPVNVDHNEHFFFRYKILFLDVLFPLNVKKIIFVDADQVTIM